MSQPNAIACPKDGAIMASLERNGVTIEQCTQCRGIFLDRGELERLIDLEQTAYPPPPTGTPPLEYPPQGSPQQAYTQPGYPPPGYGQGYRRGGGFLGEFFGGGHHGGHHDHDD